MDPVPPKIKHFFGVFRRRMGELRQQDLSLNGGLYHKTLCVCMLDTLAKAAYRTNQNRVRYTRLLREDTGWPHLERVSLPYLEALLQKYPDVPCDGLRALVADKMSRWRGGCYKLHCDLEYSSVSSLCPQTDKPFGKIRLQYLRHDSLFYQYRNGLVHEARSPGFAFEDDEDEEPYYHSASRVGEPGQWWELVYPTRFFLSIVDQTLDRLEERFTAENYDPIGPFDFGNYWIEELNE